MEYYNSLLESYDLLKKRKFKLSLKEQDVGGGSTDDQIQTVISTATGSPSSKPGEAQTINDVELWCDLYLQVFYQSQVKIKVSVL